MRKRKSDKLWARWGVIPRQWDASLRSEPDSPDHHDSPPPESSGNGHKVLHGDVEQHLGRQPHGNREHAGQPFPPGSIQPHTTTDRCQAEAGTCGRRESAELGGRRRVAACRAGDRTVGRSPGNTKHSREQAQLAHGLLPNPKHAACRGLCAFRL